MLTPITLSISLLFLVGAYAENQGPPSKPVVSVRGHRFVRHANSSTNYNILAYHPFDEQMNFLEEVADEHPSFVSVGTLGKSFEERNIKYVKIGYPSAEKPTLLIDAGFHAREWIGPAVALWSVQELTSSDKYQDLLEKVDIVIIPNMNPDGYEYSRNTERMWRKNRRAPAADSDCYGVDLNRNFPLHFGGPSTSDDPCNYERYKGPSALSEPESSSLSTFMEDNKATLEAYISLHSYGPNWMYPWGYANNTYPDDVQDLMDVGNKAAEAIARARGTQYKVSSPAFAMYSVGGNSADYAKDLRIKYAYTVELNSVEEEFKGYHFLLPEQFIQPNAQEVFQGFLVVAEAIAY